MERPAQVGRREKAKRIPGELVRESKLRIILEIEKGGGAGVRLFNKLVNYVEATRGG